MNGWTRDFRGYGGEPPHPRWPGDARVALSFVVNFEEGAELAVADGDERNEKAYEIIEEVEGGIDPCMMSHYEYATRAGYWRIMDVLAAHGAQVTVSTCGRAAERSPALMRDAVARGHEISCHGYRWERHAHMSEEAERRDIARTFDAVRDASGRDPVGWHTRSAPSVNTRRLLVEHGGFLYDSDAYNDDLPYFVSGHGRPHLVIPYAFDTNDMRFGPGGGFVQASDFATYCIGAFDRLWREGDAGRPKLMSVGLHLRLIGRPARIGGLEAFLDHVNRKGGAWICRRADVARHWREVFGEA
jgi:peptidoglycan/xylan/chitin deacetylase (PgdA/CDA1 family)